MKASLINVRLTSRYSGGSYAFAVKGLCALFSVFKIRSGKQFDGCTDLCTLCRDKSHTYLPLPQIVCLQSPRFWETRDQRLPGSLSLSPRRAGRTEPWEQGWVQQTFFVPGKKHESGEQRETSLLLKSHDSYWNVLYLVKMRNLSRNGNVRELNGKKLVDKIITLCLVEWNNMI